LAALVALGSVPILCEVGWWAGHCSRLGQRPSLKVYQVLALLAMGYTLLLFSVLFLPLSAIHRCCGKKILPSVGL